VPFSPVTGDPTDVTDPANLVPFTTALEHAGGFSGIGFSLGGGFAGIDLDGAFASDGGPWNWVQHVIDDLGSYTERSPSGRGLHIILRGTKPEGPCRRDMPGGHVEVYGERRFLTVTGDVLDGAPREVAERTAELARLHGLLFPPTQPPPAHVASVPACIEDDQELLHRAMEAANGPLFTALWRGERGPYPSDSEGDLALCSLLAFWLGSDAERIERVVSESPRGQRGKWAGRSDYRCSTVAKALEGRTVFYTPGEARPQPRERAGSDAQEATVGRAGVSHTPPAGPDQDRVMLWTSAATVGQKVGAVSWAWQGWLPFGFLTILVGASGDGKSAVALDLADRIIRGRPWPDGQPNPVPAGSPVLVIDCEGAQAIWCERVRDWGIPQEALLFPGDGFQRVALSDESVVAGVAQTVIDRGVRLVIIDSIRAALPASVDENSSSVAALLTPWCDMARDTQVGLVAVHHFNRARQGEGRTASLDRVRGSTALGALARIVIGIDHPQPTSRDEDPVMRLQVLKSNLARLPAPLGFEVGAEGIAWCEAPEEERRETASDRATSYLKDVLARKPIRREDVFDRRPGEVSRDALYEARRRLRIVEVRDPEHWRKVLWSLPASAEP
jgi:hypothetical protein